MTTAARFLLGGGLALLLAIPGQADPSVSGSFTMKDAADNRRSVRKVWGNFLAGYQQARNMAKGVVRQMQMTSSLAHSMEHNLQAWETVARQTEALLKADIWDPNPINLIVNAEENFFQKADRLMYFTVPNAKTASRQLNESRAAWVRNLSQLSEPGAELPARRAAGITKTLALGEAQKRQENQEKGAFAVRNAALVRSGLRRDEMVYMTDNANANLSAAARTLQESPESRQNEMADLNRQTSENQYVLGNMQTAQEMDRIELMTHILLAKSSAYNRAALGSYLLVSPLVELSDALNALPRETR
ncbi:MAG TPA: hypothetical protein VK465_02420 [Fibrobacteria bacterium]|nr:hypothetical protein [Fibrobacteria bacterium]